MIVNNKIVRLNYGQLTQRISGIFKYQVVRVNDIRSKERILAIHSKINETTE